MENKQQKVKEIILFVFLSFFGWEQYYHPVGAKFRKPKIILQMIFLSYLAKVVFNNNICLAVKLFVDINILLLIDILWMVNFKMSDLSEWDWGQKIQTH